MILLSAKSLCRKQNEDSLDRKPFVRMVVLEGSKKLWKSHLKANMMDSVNRKRDWQTSLYPV